MHHRAAPYSISSCQIIGEFQILGVCIPSDFLGIDLIEHEQKIALLLIGKYLVGHGEEAVIFLFNVSSKELPEALCVFNKLFDSVRVACGCCFDRGVHGSHILPALIVFDQHHSSRSSLARKPFRLHRMKEMGFLFPVMAPIREVPKEVDRHLRRFFLKLAIFNGMTGYLDQAVKDLFDDTVFVAENVSWLHTIMLSLLVL